MPREHGHSLEYLAELLNKAGVMLLAYKRNGGMVNLETEEKLIDLIATYEDELLSRIQTLNGEVSLWD